MKWVATLSIWDEENEQWVEVIRTMPAPTRFESGLRIAERLSALNTTTPAGARTWRTEHRRVE